MKLLRRRGSMFTLLLCVLVLTLSTSGLLARAAASSPRSITLGSDSTSLHVRHILLLSIDGLHEQDLARYVRLNPNSAFAQLTNMGITYTNASTSKPSDSFPGLLSMVTGGS